MTSSIVKALTTPAVFADDQFDEDQDEDEEDEEGAATAETGSAEPNYPEEIAPAEHTEDTIERIKAAFARNGFVTAGGL